MAGPWEKYGAAPAPAGPWAKYGAAPSVNDGNPIADLIRGKSTAQPPSVTEDVVKSGSSGVARGVADLIGLPGTISDALHSGGDWALKNGYEAVTGNEPAPGTFFGGALPEHEIKNPLSGDTLRSALSAVSGGATDYQPKTVPGEYARTIGEFAPNAIGPGGIVRKVAQVAIPAVTSEFAGQETKGTSLEPYARVVGALVGGGASNIAAGRGLPAVPTAKDIFAEGGNAFESAKPILKGVRVTNDSYRKIVDAMKSKADDFGMVTEAHGPLESFLKRQSNAAEPTPSGIPGVINPGAEPSLYDLEMARRGLGHIGSSNVTNKSLGALSGKLTDTLDEAVGGLTDAHLKVGDATEADKALETLSTARQTWRTGIKSQIVENAVEQAHNAASGVENGLRVEFRKLLKPNVAKNFDETELAAIKQVARGTFTQNALRWLGGFGVPTDSGRNFLGSVAGALSGNAIGGPVGAVALPAIGTAAKLGAGSIAEKNAAIVDALVKAGQSGRDLFQESAGTRTQAQRMAIARALMQSSVASQQGLPISR